jgi:peptidyl-tRNA hydrolase, PTH1 family
MNLFKFNKAKNAQNIFLIAGLGNPGTEYSLNRHNAGFLFVDHLVSKHSFETMKKKTNYHYSKNIFDGVDCAFIKPRTYMNLSGNAVVSAMGFFKIPVKNIVIIYDDVALPFGKIRIREKGTPGGHNGLKNIQAMLGTEEYCRIRIGVSAPEHSSQMRNYVLGNFSENELSSLREDTFPKIEESLKLIIEGRTREAMNKFNGNNGN